MLGFLFIVVFTRFVSMVFVMNFTTSGVNFTLGLTLLPHSALGIALFWRGVPYKAKSLKYLWWSFLGISALTLIPNALTAAIFSAISLNLLGLLFIHEVNFDQLESRIGLIGAIFLNYLIQSILDQTNVFGTLGGMVVFLIIIILGFIIVGFSDSDPILSLDTFPPAYGFLMLNLMILGNAGIIGTWTIDSFWGEMMNPDIYLFIVVFGCSVGLFAALLLLEKTSTIEAPIMEISFLVAYSDLLFTKILTVLTVPFAVFLSASLLLNVPINPERKSLRELALVQGVTFFSLFLYVAAGNWAFMPSIVGMISRGMAGFYLFLVGILYVTIVGFRRWKQ